MRVAIVSSGAAAAAAALTLCPTVPARPSLRAHQTICGVLCCDMGVPCPHVFSSVCFPLGSLVNQWLADATGSATFGAVIPCIKAGRSILQLRLIGCCKINPLLHNDIPEADRVPMPDCTMHLRVDACTGHRLPFYALSHTR